MSGESIIDSRDIINRIKELEDSISDCDEPTDEEYELANRFYAMLDAGEELSEEEETQFEELRDKIHDWDNTEDEREELEILKEFNEEGEEATSEWRYGVTLILEDYFEDYARELAGEVSSLPRDWENEWPFTHIDWEEAAEALKMDYFELDFAGNTYLVGL